MSDSNTATMEPTIGSKRTPPKQKKFPPYAVIVLNDDKHTYQYVIETFIMVFNYTPEKCFQLANEIHKQGRAIVWSGSKEVAELKKEQITSRAPDCYGDKPVKFPLGVVLEPMPQ